jgi:hypothetical protein
MSILQLSDPIQQLDHRADMLRGLAARWDDTIFRFDRTHPADCPLEGIFGRDHCLNRIIDALTASAAEYADPGLPRVEIRAYMEDLRDAVNALTRYETGNGWDGDEDPERVYYNDETVLGILNADVDYALWPLLSGLSHLNVCFRCTRSGRPALWQARVPGQPNCETHS